MPPMTMEQFGQTIKAKHPEYADMGDAELGQKVLGKYPQYQDMVAAPNYLSPQSLAASKAANAQPTQFEQAQKNTSFLTMLGNAADKVASIPGEMYQQAGPMQQILSPFTSPSAKGAALAQQATPGVQANAEAHQRGAGPIETAASTAAPYIGTNPTQLAQAAQRRDVVGMADATSGTWAPAVAGKLGGETVALGGDALKATGIPDVVKKALVGNQAKVYPEIKSWSPDAVNGAENLFKSAAPVGSNTEFRKSLYAAGGDLAEIGRKIDLSETKGGIINPDMRAKASVNAINDHLNQMYSGELKPQIMRNKDAAVVPRFSSDSIEGLNDLSSHAGTGAERAIAAKAAAGENMTLAEMNDLREATNRSLSPLREMSPQELAQAEGNSRRLGSLQSLDTEIGKSIATELGHRGEPGVLEYEKRYASLSAFRNQLETRVNAVELKQPGVIKSVTKPVISVLTGGKSGIASASQAAVADVNIGRMLQKGFKQLAGSELTPQRGVGTGPVVPAGLLGTGNIQLPSSMEGVPPAPMPQSPEWNQYQTPTAVGVPELIRRQMMRKSH